MKDGPYPVRLRDRPALGVGDGNYGQGSERRENRLMLRQIKPAVQGRRREPTDEKIGRMDSSPNGNAESHSRPHAAGPAPASTYAARSDPEPNHRYGALVAIPPQASPRSPSRRLHTM